MNSNNFKKTLYKFHDNELVDEIINDFKNPKSIFKFHKFPVCFDCPNCQLAENCNYLSIIKVISRLKDKKIINKIDQNCFNDLFSKGLTIEHLD
jgi:hypothetical protein